MKKLAIIIGIMTMSFLLNAQMSMSIQTGMKYQKTTFGYKIGNIQPYLGFGVLSAGSSMEDIDYEGEKYLSKASIRVIMPNLGIKWELLSKDILKAGVNLGVYKPFVSGKAEFDGKEDEQFREEIKKIKLFGGEIGFYTEYFFSQHFSIGGEFGVRMAKSNYDQEKDIKFSVNLGLTYSTFSANFYF